MNLTADGQAVMENRYRYDAVDNILGITNAANPTSLTKLNKAKLGGRSSHTYEYDELNRLVSFGMYTEFLVFGHKKRPKLLKFGRFVYIFVYVLRKTLIFKVYCGERLFLLNLQIVS